MAVFLRLREQHCFVECCISPLLKLIYISNLNTLLCLPFHEDHGMKQNKSKTNHDYCAFCFLRTCSNVWRACVILIKKQTRCLLKIQGETYKTLLFAASTVATTKTSFFLSLLGYFTLSRAVIRCQGVCN